MPVSPKIYLAAFVGISARYSIATEFRINLEWMEDSELTGKVADHVISLMGELLPPTLFFHNLSHTTDVVFAVSEIGEHLKLDNSEMDILKIAAWFHDCGYLYEYTGHEEISKVMARTYLIRQAAKKGFIEDVLACINATKMPQEPKNTLQQIICDADFYHFTLKGYGQKAHQLRKEWEIYRGKFYNDADWNQLNLNLLQQHQYFTTYGKEIWQPLKMKNISLLERNMLI